MTRVNDLAKELSEQLFTASETRFWKKRTAVPEQMKEEGATPVTIQLKDTSFLINPISVATAKIKRKRPCYIRVCDVHSMKLKCVPRIPKQPEGSSSLTVLNIL